MKNRRCNHILYALVQATWGVLQNIGGVLLLAVIKIKDPARKVFFYHGAVVCHWRLSGSMGLGMFIFFGHYNEEKSYADAVLVHEYGHTVQSCILGPLYLIVIGLPSMVWNGTPLFQRWRREGRYTYYDFYPEGWANYEGERVLKQPAPKRRLADEPGQ